MAKTEAVAPDAVVAEAPESAAREYFSTGGRTLPTEKPENLTRQQWSMLREHVAHGRSYAEVGRLHGDTSADSVRTIIGHALERLQA